MTKESVEREPLSTYCTSSRTVSDLAVSGGAKTEEQTSEAEACCSVLNTPLTPTLCSIDKHSIIYPLDTKRMKTKITDKGHPIKDVLNGDGHSESKIDQKLLIIKSMIHVSYPSSDEFNYSQLFQNEAFHYV